MRVLSQESITRTILTLLILSAGVALVPFVDRPGTAIGWELFAGVYSPTLDVNEIEGAPGSVFTFTGSGYPAFGVATVYVNGEPRGTVTADGSGMAAFFFNTVGAAEGHYNITMEVDINASATNGFDIVVTSPVVLPAPGATGPTFFVNHVLFLPAVQK